MAMTLNLVVGLFYDLEEVLELAEPPAPNFGDTGYLEIGQTLGLQINGQMCIFTYAGNERVQLTGRYGRTSNEPDPASDAVASAEERNKRTDSKTIVKSLDLDWLDFALREPVSRAPTLKDRIEAVSEAYKESEGSPSEYAMHMALMLRQHINVRVRMLLDIDQAVHDGFVLAAEQVQDKRIDFLERGPELKTTELVLEVIIGVAVFSPVFIAPLLGGALKLTMGSVRAASARRLMQAKPQALARRATRGRDQRRWQDVHEDLEQARLNLRLAKEYRMGKPPAAGGFNPQLRDKLLTRWTQSAEKSEEFLKESKELLLGSVRRAEEARDSLHKSIHQRSERTKKAFEKLRKEHVKSWLLTEEKLARSTPFGAAVAAKGAEKALSPKRPLHNSVSGELRRVALKYLRRRQRTLSALREQADTLAFEALANPDDLELIVGELVERATEVSLEPFEDIDLDQLTSDAAFDFEHILWIYLLRPLLGDIVLEESQFISKEEGPIWLGGQKKEVERGSRINTQILSYIIERFGPFYESYREIYARYPNGDWEKPLRDRLREQHSRIQREMGSMGSEGQLFSFAGVESKGSSEPKETDANAGGG